MLRDGLRQQGTILSISETVRLKSYPVTCEWSAKRVVARTVYCCFFLSLRYAAASIVSLRYAVALFCRSAPLREGLRRKELFFLFFETVRLKSYPVT
jgi:hypothetical protein